MISRVSMPGFGGRSLCMSAVTMAMTVTIALLAGCGDKKKDKPASQTAAKVNKEEITVHQINFVLQQQRGLAPDQAASASKQALERLIDQELALQKALDQKVDRDPKVVQQLDAARREIIARAYIEKISSGASKPSPAEIKGYYDTHLALFKERRLYSLQELTIEVKPDQIAMVRAKLEAAKGVPEFIEFLKATNIKFGANQAVRAAEQLPLASLDRIAALKDGQSVFSQTPTGATILILVGSRSQPVDEIRATPAIEQFLLNDRKRKVVEEDLRALRTAAKVEYVGDYAKGGTREITPPTALPVDAPPLTSVAPPQAPGSTVTAAPQIEVEAPIAASAAMPAGGTMDKGMKGFK